MAQIQLTIHDKRQNADFPLFVTADNHEDAVKRFEYMYADRDRYTLVADKKEGE